ncbi:MAG: ABC transporter permease [Kiritimatiellae bacterium]|nr:ABC transporter permease [Kiritimatiellia bacterium]
MDAKRTGSGGPRRALSRFAAGGGAAWLALAALALVCSLSSPVFARPANLLNVARQSSYTGLVALGMTFVVVAGGIDLSVGSLFAFSGVAAAQLLSALPGAAGGGAAFAAACAALCAALGAAGGAVNGALVAAGRLPPFIATLGTYSLFRSLSLWLADSGSVPSPGWDNAVTRFGQAAPLGVPSPVWILLALAAALGVALSRTPWGRHAVAAGAGERVARFAGVRVGRVRFATYVLAGALAGLSAFLALGRLGTLSSSNAGLFFELDAIAAVVIGGASMSGGRASVSGTLAGAFVLGVLSNALQLWGVDPSLQGAVKGLAIVLSVLVQRRAAAAA